VDVRSWLAELGLEAYAEAFAANDVDASVLSELTEADLEALGVRSLGHRKKLLAAIRRGLEPVTQLERPEPRADDAAPSEALARALEARGYALTDALGTGGMGAVFRARQLPADRDVAIKVLRARARKDGDARFAREARAIAALTHPNSVRLFDLVDAGDGTRAIVMEYVRGESLAALLRRERRLPFARAARLLLQVLDALTEAHAKGIVHRDLKPANVLLQSAHGYGDFARVLDFGLARWIGAEESRLTQTGAIAGTPRYLSPEQIQGGDATLQSDLYAVGVVLHEMLAGAPPFTADVDAALMYQHLREEPPPLPADVERPPELDALLARLLAKAPALRPASAYAVRRELAQLLGGAEPSPRESVTASVARSVGAAPERRRVAALDVELAVDDDAAPADTRHALLARCRAVADAVRRRHGGYLEAVRGAAQTWTFGAPVARKGDARRALEAALDLRDALSRVDGARCRIGVAEGPAVAGGTGEPEGRYFVVGPPIDEAARLRRTAGDGEIQVARGLVDDAVIAEGEPEESAARLLGLRRAADASTSDLPFVGRERELEELESALSRCRHGTGRVVVVAGEAGIGKSRLVARVCERARAAGIPSARGQIHDAESAPEDDVLRQLVGALLALPEDPETRAEALEARLGQNALGPAQWPFFFHFLEIPLSGPMQRVYDAMEPRARRAGYRDAIAALLATETVAHPLVLVVEDVHWADAKALDAIETLSGLSRALPILLALTTRVEGEERWRHALAGQTVTRLELEPLAPDAAAQLAARLGASPSLRARAVERAGGHPLLLTEMLRVPAGDDDSSLPPTVHGLIQGRLDRLPEVDRRAVQVAAALGPRVRLGDLRAVLEEPDYAPARLAEWRLLRQVERDVYAFTHALVRDAVYDALVPERRRALHAACAAHLDRDPALAATHHERAGQSERAAERYLEAARRALADDRYEDALDLATRSSVLGVARHEALRLRGEALLVLGDATEAEETFVALRREAPDDAHRLRALLGRAEALRIANRWDDALDALDDADALSGGRSARSHYLRGGIYFATGRLEECGEAHAAALEVARDRGDVELMARASSGAADALYGSGRMTEAAPRYEECIARSREAGLLGVEVVNRPMLSIVSVFLLELDAARAHADASLAQARELSHQRGETLAHGAASLAALHAGDAEASVDHALEALGLTRVSRSVVFAQTAHYYAARALLALRDEGRARSHVEAGVALCRQHSMSFLGGALLALAARLEPDAAEARLSEGEAVILGPALSFNRLWFRENAIEAALEGGRPDEALRHARALREETADAPFAWATLMADRGEALALAARGDDATDRLRAARDAARACGLALSLPALEAALSR